MPSASSLRPVAAVVISLFLLLVALLNVRNHHMYHGRFLALVNEHLATHIVMQTNRMINDVFQVQQFLTDISATMGLDGLDDGFDRAWQASESFQGRLAQLRLLFSGPWHGKMSSTVSLDDLGNRFQLFHSTGVEMAQAYIHSGTLRGNEIMRRFDAEADALADELTKISEESAVIFSANPYPEESDPVASGALDRLWVYLMGTEIRTHFQNFHVNLIKNRPKNNLSQQTGLLAQDLSTQVVQIQQWLTDISVTRGQDGLNRGWENAHSRAIRFLSAQAEFQKMVQEMNDRQKAQSIVELQPHFERYYATGLAMATAYIEGGAPHGNPLMKQFDAMADELNDILQKFIEPSPDDFQIGMVHVDFLQYSLHDTRNVLMIILFLMFLLNGISLWWLDLARRSG
ncbi:MAG: hypothetical protein H7833_11470 [Magnetococcus sp. DMHC-1]